MATYYVDLASGTMPANDGLTETGFFGWTEFYAHVYNGAGHEFDTYKLRNTHSETSSNILFGKFGNLEQWNSGAPWRIINTSGSIVLSSDGATSISYADGGILKASGWTSLLDIKLTNCFVQAEVIEVGRSTITSNSGILDGCTIDVSGLYLPDNFNHWGISNTILKANSFTNEAGANGLTAEFNNVVTNLSESDLPSEVTVTVVDTEYDYDLDDYADATTIVESGLATPIQEKYKVYTNPSIDMFNNTRYAVGAVTPSSILFFVATPASGAIPYTPYLVGYSNSPITPTSWNWDFGDSTTGSGKTTFHTYSGVGSYLVILSPSGSCCSGLYLNTYISDDFGDCTGASGFNSGWDPAFKNTKIVDCSGYMQTNGGDADTLLIGSGAVISGRFDFQFDFAIGCTNGGNTSLHFYIKNSGGTTLHALDWNGGLQYDGSGLNLPDDGYVAGRRYTVRMTRGYSLDSSGAATQEGMNVVRSYYLDNWSGGSTNDWIEMVGSPESGAALLANIYTEVNNATYNGYDNLILQADAGLPYTNTCVSSGFSLVTSGYVIAYAPTEITGLVQGQEFILTFPLTLDNIIGDVKGYPDISALMSFVYPPTGEPPSASGILMRGIKPRLTNKGRYPYKIPTDVTLSKLDFLNGGRYSYLQGLSVELWMNYNGTWEKMEDAVTDRYGTCYIEHPTAAMPNITNCLGIAKVTYNNGTYISNVMRYNFFKGDLVFIIDAGPSGVADRSGYDIFDGSGRLTYFDRMAY